MDRAKVIVHMHTSIDGKIDGEYGRQAGDKISGAFYSAELFRLSNANANGATTVKMYAAKGQPQLSKFVTTGINYEDWVPVVQSETWDVSFDRKGTAGWQTNYFDYGGKRSHAIEVVTKQASKQYLAFLQSMVIPYLVCGKTDLDIPGALIKLKKYFGIQSIALAGGSIINGAFLKAGFVDEISLVVSPYVSGDRLVKSVFDTAGKFVSDRFKIKNITKLQDGGIHLIFEKDGTNE